MARLLQPHKASRLPATMLAGFVVLWLAVNSAWYAAHRLTQPKNIDEYGYYSLALNYYYGLATEGVFEWAARVLGTGVSAPATTAATSLLLPVTGPRFSTGIALVLTTGAATLIMLYLLLRPLVSTQFALLAVVLVASAPIFMQMSRMYMFAVPLSAVVIGAMLALQRSAGLTRIGPSLTLGVLVGLFPLTRNMAVAFVPGVALATVLVAWATPGDRRAQIRNVLSSGAAALLVAGSWLLPNFHSVFGYLTSYGYGSHASEYARAEDSVLSRLFEQFGYVLHATHLLVLLIGWLAAGVVAVSTLRRGRLGRAQISSPTATTALAASITVILASAALASTANAGSGFALPLIAPAAAVMAIGLDRLLGTHLGLGRALVALAAAGLILITSPYAGVESGLGERRELLLPGVGTLPLTGGDDENQAYLGTVTTVATDPDDADGWRRLNDELAAIALAEGDGHPSVAFGFRGLFVNVNSFQANVMLRTGYAVGVAQIDPSNVTTASEAAAWLRSGDAATSCLLLTSAGEINEFVPAPDTTMLIEVARSIGFSPISTLGAPDGRTIEIWERTEKGCER